jgi:hypothetical protein
MIDRSTDRRKFLKVLISLPLAFRFGYEPRLVESAVQKTSLNPEGSLKKLIFLLGPWSPAKRKEAEDFARRFLKAKHAVNPYLPGSSALVQGLASRFPDVTSINEINLGDLSPAERNVLMQLVKQLYSMVEVRFVAANEPPWGQCQADRLRHTRAPR